jgi:hypothetical protein
MNLLGGSIHIDLSATSASPSRIPRVLLWQPDSPGLRFGQPVAMEELERGRSGGGFGLMAGPGP